MYHKICYFILLMFSIVFTQFDWQDNGVPVRQGIHIEWQRTGDVGNQGEMIFAWSDTRYGGRDIYAKKIDKDGNDIWGSEGVPIVIAPGRQEDPILVSDDAGGAFIIWVDYRNEPESGDIYAQHVNSDGIISWDSEGVPLTIVEGKQVAPNMSKDGIGGAFVIWNDQSISTLGHIYGTHLTTNVNDIIAANVGVPIISNDSQHSGVSIEEAADGSAIMVWTDDINLDNSDLDLFAQRIDVNCNTLWTAPDEGGVPICTHDNVQQYAKVTYYSETISVIVWEDRRNNPNAGDVYAQFIDMNGNVTSELNGFSVCSNESMQIKPRVKASPFGAHVVWEDKRNGNSDIYGQFLTIDNGSEWEDDGIAICTINGAQDQPRLTTDDSGGAFYVWMDERYNSFPETEIFLQHLDVNGSSSFDLNGISVSSAPQYQFNPLVRNDGEDGALVVWGDMRSGSIGLYAQHINTLSNSISFEEDGIEFYFGIDGNGLGAKSLYLGDNQNLLYWEDHRLGVIADLTYGQKVYNGWEQIQDPNGLKLSNNSYQTNPKVESLGENVFLGFAQAFGDIKLYYQLLSSEITMLGEQEGTPVYDTFIPQSGFDLMYSSSGNSLYIAFSQLNSYFTDSDIYVQKFSENGDAQYSDPILVVDNFLMDDNIIFVTELDNSNVIIGYDSGSFAGTRSLVLAFDSQGNVLEDWIDVGSEIVGKRLSSDENDQFIKGYANSENNVLVIWKDQRTGNADIYGQLLNSNGDLLLDIEGVAIGSGANDQQNPTITYNEVTSEFMVCWEDFTGLDFNILCRTINNDTHELSEVIILCDQGSNQKSPYVHSTLDGSYLFAWEDSRNSVTSDIYFQKLKDNEFTYESNGIVLCDADFNQKNPQIDMYSESENTYMIFWDDLRSSGKEDLTNIYVQSIDLENISECLIGDISGDGLINVLDVVNLVNYVLGSVEFSDAQYCSGDLNQDGLINVLDVVTLVNSILNI